MDKERIKKLAENPKFIPGIYNYCDRWCERCRFTSRCINFALAEEQFGDSQARDMDNDAFWQKLSEIFQSTLEMLKETAKEEGIDLDSLDVQQVAQEHEKKRDIVKNHQCCRAAKAYGEMVKNWFDSAEDLFEKKADELNLKVQLELTNSDPVSEADALTDSVDIIQWYQHQIYVKLIRAIGGSLEETSETSDEVSKDSNGSAKVALIAIDRSIAAWGQMYRDFPEQQGDILDILVHLDRLCRKTQALFPDARAFLRPGFDCANQCGHTDYKSQTESGCV